MKRILTTHVRVRDDGTVESSKPFATSDDRTGNWRLSARWVAPNHVTGNFQVTTPGCDGGVRMFSAHQGDHDHDHAGHTAFGTPLGSYPDLDAGSSEVRAAGIATRGVSEPGDAPFRHISRRGRPRISALASPMGGSVDVPRASPRVRARRPRLRSAAARSLVYWWPPAGEPVLVAFMYRMPLPDGWPRFGRPSLGWHAHGGDKPGRSLMTHVWMTADLRSAIANCMPVAALEAFTPRSASSRSPTI